MTTIFSVFNEWFEWILDCISVVPGSSIFINYIRKSYQNDPLNIFIEAMLVFFSIKYLTSKTYSIDSAILPLTEHEIDELVLEWKPEPLINQEIPEMEQLNLDSARKIKGSYGLHVELANGQKALNVSSFNPLGIANESFLKEIAVETVDSYAVGTCGPPGFYGSLDVHLVLENVIANFLGAESAILYSQASAVISSVIPAFSKVGDILIVDVGCNFSIQKGVELSKSQVFKFLHNDMADLERVLKQVQVKFAKKPLTRRFIVVEGLYANYGDICPLPEIVKLKEKYRYRLMIDESLSIGALGKRGAGVSDVYHVPFEKLEIVMGSLVHSFGGGGGFCAGSLTMVDHQRLNGKSYCFSASLPAYLANTAKVSIQHLMKESSKIIPLLENNIQLLTQKLATIPGLKIASPFQSYCKQDYSGSLPPYKSPLIHLYLRKIFDDPVAEARLLDLISDHALEKGGVLISRAKYLQSKEWLPIRPSLRLVVSAGYTNEDLDRIVSALAIALNMVLNN